MNNQNKTGLPDSLARAAGPLGENQKSSTTNFTKLPSKKRRVLMALIDGRSFNRFEAERQLNDHVLNTTISELQAYGVTIARQYETVPGYRGIPTRCCRYRLDREQLKRAHSVLKRLR